jgi:hypothetical protein
MAKLKICDNSENLLPQGYINVVNQLVDLATPESAANFQDFIDADPEERPELLQELVNVWPSSPPPAPNPPYPNPRPVFVVTQQKIDVPPGTPKQIAIDQSNCRIIAQNDTRVRAKKKRTRITMPFPDTRVPDFGYLEAYVQTIMSLYLEVVPLTPPIPNPPPPPTYRVTQDAFKKLQTFKFMFGVMMLTRCR